MKVQRITKFVYKGTEYKSLKELKGKLHDTIGIEVLDKISKTCPLQKHKDYFKLLDLLCSPEVRKVLTECLNVTFEELDEHDHSMHGAIEKNVLDI